MKTHVKTLIAAAGSTLALLGTPAQALDIPCVFDTSLDQCYAGAVSSSTRSFSDWTIGDLALDTVSNVFGYLATAGFDLTQVSLVNNGTMLTDSDLADGISFNSVASGNYAVRISGDLTSSRLFGHRYGLYAGGFQVMQIPEPETYALFLAGLLTIGYVARRRQQG